LVISEYVPQELRIFDNLLFYDVYRQPPMNTYIEWGAETGVTGLAILGFVIYRVYRFGKSRIGSFDRKFVRLSCGAGLLSLLISCNSSSGNFFNGSLGVLIGMYLSGLKIYGPRAK
jgi:hypothetical protein